MNVIVEKKTIDTIIENTSYHSFDGKVFYNLGDCISYELAHRFEKHELTKFVFYTVHNKEEFADLIKELSTVNQFFLMENITVCNVSLDGKSLIYASELKDNKLSKLELVEYPLTFTMSSYTNECDYPDEMSLYSLKEMTKHSANDLKVAELNFIEITDLTKSLDED